MKIYCDSVEFMYHSTLGFFFGSRRSFQTNRQIDRTFITKKEDGAQVAICRES